MLTPDRLKRGMRVQYTGHPLIEAYGRVVHWDTEKTEAYVMFPRGSAPPGPAYPPWIAVPWEDLDEIDHAANDVLPAGTPTYLYMVSDEEDVHHDDGVTPAPRVEQVEVMGRDTQWVYVVPCRRAFGQRYRIPLAEAAQMHNPRVAWEAYRDRQAQRYVDAEAVSDAAHTQYHRAMRVLAHMKQED